MYQGVWALLTQLSFSVNAICQVVGGPKYKIKLKGQAALVQYAFDKHFIDFGEQVSLSIFFKRWRVVEINSNVTVFQEITCTSLLFQHYDQIATAEIELFNQGKIPLNYSTIGINEDKKPGPGELTVTSTEKVSLNTN